MFARRFLMLIILLWAFAFWATHTPIRSVTPVRAASSTVSSGFQDLAPIGQLGGAAFAIETKDRLAAVVNGLSLDIYDLANAARPVKVGRTPPITHNIHRLMREGDRLYAFAQPDALLIFDWSDAIPTLLAESNLPGEPRLVKDGILYLFVDEGRDIRLWDVSHPESGFVELGRWQDEYKSSSIAVAGNLAFVLKNDDYIPSSLVVLDKGHLPDLRVIHAEPLTDYGGDVAVRGDHVFVLNGDQFWVFQQMPDGGLTLRGRTTIHGASIVAVQDDFVFLAGRTDVASDLEIVDVSDPEQPMLKSKTANVAGTDAAVMSHYFLSALQTQGWLVLDVSSPESPSVVARQRELPVNPQDIAVQDHLAYVVDDDAFLIIDASDPTQPRILAHHAFSDPPPVEDRFDGIERWQIFVQEHRAYIGIREHLYIFDITQPTHPVLLKTLDNPGKITDIIGFADRIYLGGRPVTTISPAADEPPQVLQGVSASTLFAQEDQGRRLLYAIRRASFSIIDVTDDAHPQGLGSACLLDECWDRYGWDMMNATVVDQNIFFASGAIFDASDITKPVRVPAVGPTVGRVQSVGHLVFYTSDQLHVVDITDPTSPQMVARSLSSLDRWIFRWSEGIWPRWLPAAIEGNTIYTLGVNGLQIFQLGSSVPPEPSLLPLPTATPTPPPANVNFELLGSYGGHPWAGPTTLAVAEGDIVYTAHDNVLVITDTSNPEAFRILSRSDPLPTAITSIDVQDGILYLQTDGLLVMDVRDPSRPKRLTYLPAVQGEVRATGQRIYLLQSHLWRIFDVSNPSHPRAIGEWAPPDALGDVAFDDRYAYLVKENDLAIYDFQDPSHPQAIAHFTSPFWVGLSEVALDSHFLAVLGINIGGAGDPCADGYLYVFDVIDPSQIRLDYEEYLYSCWSLEGYSGLVMSYPYVFAGHVYRSFEGPPTPAVYNLIRWDLRRAHNPQLASFQDDIKPLSEIPYPLTVTNSRVYALHQNDIIVYNVEPFQSLPLLPGSDQYLGFALGESLGGDGPTLYMGGKENLIILDNANPAQPQFVNEYRLKSAGALFDEPRMYVHFFHIHEYAGVLKDVCVADMRQGPDSPCIPVTSTEDSRHDIALSASKGWLLADSKDAAFPHYDPIYKLIDAREPERARVVDTLPVFKTDKASIAILEDGTEDPLMIWGLHQAPYVHTLRFSRASQFDDEPLAQFTWPTASRSFLIRLVNDTLYVLTDYDLGIVNVSDPVHPYIMGRYAFAHTQGVAGALKIARGRAYVGLGQQLRVVDLTDPQNMTETGRYHAPGIIHDIHIHNRIISLAADDAGMVNLYDRQLPGPYLYWPLIQK